MTARATSPSSRLLKKVPNFVLGSSQSSTYPRGYASGCDSPAASLDDFFEQPAESDCCGLAVELFEHSASLKFSKVFSQTTCVPLRYGTGIPERAGCVDCR